MNASSVRAVPGRLAMGEAVREPVIVREIATLARALLDVSEQRERARVAELEADPSVGALVVTGAPLAEIDFRPHGDRFVALRHRKERLVPPRPRDEVRDDEDDRVLLHPG